MKHLQSCRWDAVFRADGKEQKAEGRRQKAKDKRTKEQRTKNKKKTKEQKNREQKDIKQAGVVLKKFAPRVSERTLPRKEIN